MGLNAYETDAYIALLEGGQMTAMEISNEAKVPYSKTYEVLNSLKQKGWIKSTETRPSSIIQFHRLKQQRLRNAGWSPSTKAGAAVSRGVAAALREEGTRGTTRHTDSPWTTSNLDEVRGGFEESKPRDHDCGTGVCATTAGTS